MSIFPKGLLRADWLINHNQLSNHLSGFVKWPAILSRWPLSSPSSNTSLYMWLSKILFITHIIKDRSTQADWRTSHESALVIMYPHSCHRTTFFITHKVHLDQVILSSTSNLGCILVPNTFGFSSFLCCYCF